MVPWAGVGTPSYHDKDFILTLIYTIVRFAYPSCPALLTVKVARKYETFYNKNYITVYQLMHKIEIKLIIRNW